MSRRAGTLRNRLAPSDRTVAQTIRCAAGLAGGALDSFLGASRRPPKAAPAVWLALRGPRRLVGRVLSRRQADPTAESPLTARADRGSPLGRDDPNRGA